MKDIIAFDVETTGLDPKNDYIIQLSACKIDGVNFNIKDKRNYMISPQHKFVMSPGAQKAHGYTEEFIKEVGVSLKSIAKDFLDFIGDSDYLSYNGNTYDIKFLIKDFKLAGYDFPIEGRKFYDSYAMECKFSPRTLSAVYQKYTGQEMHGAHDSFNDVLATIQIFKKQIENHNLTLDEIQKWSENNILSPEGSIRNASNSEESDIIVFAYGKYKDSEIYKICCEDPSYVKWWSENIASDYTKKILRQYLLKQKELHKKSKSK